VRRRLVLRVLIRRLQDQDRLPLDGVIELPAVRYVIELAKRGGRAGSDCGGTAPSGSSAQIARSAGSVIW